MLGNANEKLTIKQELLTGATVTIGSLAVENDRFRKERACNYVEKAHSNDFVAKNKPTDSDLVRKYRLLQKELAESKELAKKYRALEKELTVSNGKVKNLTRAMREVETVFELMKDNRADLGRICAALKIKLGKATSKVEKLAKENRILKHLNEKLENLKCPNKTNHLKTAKTLSALAKECTANTANITPILKEKPSPGSNKRRAEETKAVSDERYELEKENDEHVGVKVKCMIDDDVRENNTVLEKIGELDSDKDDIDGDAPNSSEDEEDVTSINVEDAGSNSKKATKEVHVRSGGHDMFNKTSGRKSHKCNECGKICRDNNTLKKHMTTHSQARSYKCSKCEKTFKRKNTLNRHLTGRWRQENGKYYKGCSVTETTPSNERPPKGADNESVDAETEPSEVVESIQVNISDADDDTGVKLEKVDPIQVIPEMIDLLNDDKCDVDSDIFVKGGQVENTEDMKQESVTELLESILNYSHVRENLDVEEKPEGQHMSSPLPYTNFKTGDLVIPSFLAHSADQPVTKKARSRKIINLESSKTKVTSENDLENEEYGEASNAMTQEPRKLAGGKNLEEDHRVTGPVNSRIVSVLQGAAPGLVIRNKRRKVGH